jgi:hypothetical protein
MRHAGDQISLAIRERIEEANGWNSQVVGIDRAPSRGRSHMGLDALVPGGLRSCSIASPAADGMSLPGKPKYPLMLLWARVKTLKLFGNFESD